MKKTSYILLAFILFGCTKGPQIILISNPNEFDLTHKLVTIQKELLCVNDIELPIIRDENNEIIPTQLVDDDQDGAWDQLIFQVSIIGQSNAEFIVEWVAEDMYPSFAKQTQVYLGYSESRKGNFVSVDQNKRDRTHVPQKTPYTYQFEGPGWESNLVAFRSYFDTRNGKDIFGKTKEEMVTQKIGIGENYHVLQAWGMDVLKVGQSLGSGALAIIKNDSLIRLGETASAEFRKVNDGPILSSFKLVYKGWDVFDKMYEVQEHISIQANKRWFESSVTILSEGQSRTDTLVVGIVNLKDADVESIDYMGIKTLFTHGIQSENNDALGMALIIEDAYFLNSSKAPVSGEGITNSELVYLKPESNSYTYHFYAGWELERKQFKYVEGFKNELEMTMKELSADLTVNVK